MKVWLTGILRMGGGLLSLMILFGFIWSAGTLSWTKVLPAIFLLTLSLLPTKVVRQYPFFLILGGIGCIGDVIATGLPFLRPSMPFDVELMYLIQWGLIFFFIFQAHRQNNGWNLEDR